MLGSVDASYSRRMDTTLSPGTEVLITAGPYHRRRATIQGLTSSGYDVRLEDGTTISVPREWVRLRPVPPDDADMLITRWIELGRPPILLRRSRPGYAIRDLEKYLYSDEREYDWYELLEVREFLRACVQSKFKWA